MTQQAQQAPVPALAQVSAGVQGRRHPSSRVWGVAAGPAGFLAPVVLVCFAVITAGLVQSYALPSPVDAWKAFSSNPGYPWTHTPATTGETVAWFVIASVVGGLAAGLTGTGAGGVVPRGTPPEGSRRHAGFASGRTALPRRRNAHGNILFQPETPGHREYETTLENPEFQRITGRIRELPGSTATTTAD